MKSLIVASVGFGAAASFSADAATVSQIHNAPGWLPNHAYTAGQRAGACESTRTCILTVNSNQSATAKFSAAAPPGSPVKISDRAITPSFGNGVTSLLQMPAGIKGTQTVDVGSGPHVIHLVLANTAGQPANQFIVTVSDGTHDIQVTGPMMVTTTALGDFQHFYLRGDWGIKVTQIKITGAGGPGLNALWLGTGAVGGLAGVYYDKIQYAYLGPSIGGGAPSQGAITFDNDGAPMTWTPCDTYTWLDCLPNYTASASVISGARVNGVVQSPTTLDNIVNQGPTGPKIAQLPAGRFVGSSRIWIPGNEVHGAGMGTTIIDARNFMPFQGKAIFDLETHAIKLTNMTITGAQVGGTAGSGNGQNAGGVFFAEGGTVDHVEFTMNQDGVRGQSIDISSPITIKNSYFHDNGSRTGFTHEIYIAGGPLATYTNNTVVSGDRSTHALKSRAAHSVVQGGKYSGCTDPTHQACGSVMDFPDGGDVEITGTTIVVTSNAIAQNGSTIAIGYGLEDGKGGITHLNLSNVLIDNRAPSAPRIIANKPGATLNLNSCTYKGSFAPSIEGWTTVNGSCTQAP